MSASDIEVDEKRKLRGGPVTEDMLLGDLTVKQFGELFLSLLQTSDFQHAMREQKVTQQIFRDAEGIVLAGMTPARIKSQADWIRETEWVDGTLKSLSSGTELVVAFALVSKAGYRKP